MYQLFRSLAYIHSLGIWATGHQGGAVTQ